MNPLDLAIAAGDAAADIHHLGIDDVIGITARTAYSFEVQGSEAAVTVSVHTHDAATTDVIADHFGRVPVLPSHSEQDTNYTRHGVATLASGLPVVLHVYGPQPVEVPA